MSEHEDFYTPEQVDEQVEALRQTRGMPSRDQRLATDLRSILETTTEDATSLQRVLQKLKQNDTTPQQQGRIIPLADWHSNQQERFAPMDRPIKRTTMMGPVTRVLSTIAAGLVIVVIVGSLIAVLSARQQKQPGSITGSPKTTTPKQATQKPAKPTGHAVNFTSKAYAYASPGVWSPDSKRVALITLTDWNAHTKLQSWDALTGRNVLTYSTNNDPHINAIAWSPDGTQLTVAGSAIYVFDAKTTKLLHTYTVPSVALNHENTSALGAVNTTKGMTPLSSIAMLSGGGDGILFGTVSWSPDGKYLAAGHDDAQNKFFVWDAKTGALFKTLTGFGGGSNQLFTAANWSSNGQTLAIQGIFKTTEVQSGKGSGITVYPETQIWDTTTWQIVKRYSAYGYLSPNGKQLALAEDNSVRIVDTQSGQTITHLALSAQDIIWSPDGTRIAAETMQSTNLQRVSLWRATNGTLLYQSPIPLAQVNGLTWSPDGKHISTVQLDPHSTNMVNVLVWTA